jgi:hypothetical protein
MAEFELEGGRLLAAADAKISVVAGACFVLIVRRSSTLPISMTAKSGGRIFQTMSTDPGLHLEAISLSKELFTLLNRTYVGVAIQRRLQ